jgi:SOS-response transcriptional repressor LexA
MPCSPTDAAHERGPVVRLVAPDRAGPFVPGRETVFAKVEGSALAALEIHHGDHVVLVRREAAEHGDLAAVLDQRGEATLWKVYPEGDALRLTTGRPGEERRVAPAPRIHGVVVAVLRRAAPPPFPQGGSPARQS